MNTERPNLLVFMCDQLQAAAVRGSDVATPNFDRLASRGVRFTHAYAPNPVCSPSRASFMTGLLPHNHGVRWVTHTVARDQGLLREEHRHWAQDLQDSGYRTMYFGKWHVEHTEDPSRFGWDLDYSLHSKRYRDAAREAAVSDGTDCLGSIRGYVSEPSGYKQRLLYGSSTKQPEKRHLGFLTSLALQEMEGIKGPWCCFVSTPEPHDPFVCSDSSLEDVDIDSLELPTTLYDDLSGRPKMYAKSRRAFDDLSERQHREARACYYASVRELDTELGRLLSFLEKTDQLDETIVVLTSDHGESLGDHGTYFKNVSASESIFGIPMIIAGPGVDRRGDCAARVSLHDLAQTLRELSGNEANDVPDSRSFLRLLRSSENDGDYAIGFAESDGGRVIFTQRVVWNGRWKLVFNGFDEDELYDLESDRSELENLAGDPNFSELHAEMTELMWDRIAATGDRSLLDTDYPPLRLAAVGPGDRGAKSAPAY